MDNISCHPAALITLYDHPQKLDHRNLYTHHIQFIKYYWCQK